MKMSEVDGAANEVISWIQDAVGDLAYNYRHPDALGSDWAKAVQKAKEEGVIDIKGWLADEYYNDVDTLMDLCGDRIYDEAKGDDWDYVQICMRIRQQSHRAMRVAMNRLIARKREHSKTNNPEQVGFTMMTLMDDLAVKLFGHTLTAAFETECCIKCGVKLGSPDADYYKNGFCKYCKKGGD